MKYKILIVDDEAANLRLLERLFRRDYQVISATSGDDALELLKMHDFALIVSDQRMPGMTGVEFLQRAATMRPHTVRVILTGYTDVNALVEAINSGVVYKYVTKPWNNEDLHLTVIRAIEHYETIKSQYELTVQNKRLVGQLNRMNQMFVRLIGDTLDLKDSFLHAHLQRVSGYAVAIGQRLNLDESELEQLALGAFLHDVGKIGVPNEILHKTSPLAVEERQMYKRCAKRGVEMLACQPEMSEVATIVRYHTEHFDGTGFPENLSAEQIPLFSRIIAVAGAYDEMVEPFDKNEALTHQAAIEKLRSEAGKRFDASVVEAFCRIEPISRIRQAIAREIVAMRLPNKRIACDAKNISTGEVLQKFKTEPLLALDVLRIGNSAGSDEPTAQLLPLMSKIGEAKLRSLLDEYGLPAADSAAKTRTTHALRRAVAAQLLTAHTGIMHPDDAYTLGLLHDVGEDLLFNLFPDAMTEAENAPAMNRQQRRLGFFGIDDAQITRWMLEAAGVPADLTAAIENHPNFMRRNQPVALMMMIACKIADTELPDKTAQMNSIDSSVLELLNLSRADLNKIYERAAFISEGQAETTEPIAELVY